MCEWETLFPFVLVSAAQKRSIKSVTAGLSAKLEPRRDLFSLVLKLETRGNRAPVKTPLISFLNQYTNGNVEAVFCGYNRDVINEKIRSESVRKCQIGQYIFRYTSVVCWNIIRKILHTTICRIYVFH